MSIVTCFLVVETDRERRWLRRFVHSTQATCPLPHGYHDASVLLGDGPCRRNEAGYYESVPAEETPADDDPRWPVACACGYAFKPGDARQVFTEVIMRRGDTGEEWPRRELPAGAMYDAWWGYPFGVGPDGKAWTIVLPDGIEWCPAHPSTNGTPWTISGEAPRLTARPSILTPRYHGFLTDGRLESC